MRIAAFELGFNGRVQNCAMVLIPQQGLPSSDLLVHSKRLVLRCPEDPPAAKACGSIDGPIPSDQRQSGRHLILDHPENHRRAITRRGANRKPSAAHAVI
jgi:hypothetical protein